MQSPITSTTIARHVLIIVLSYLTIPSVLAMEIILGVFRKMTDFCDKINCILYIKKVACINQYITHMSVLNVSNITQCLLFTMGVIIVISVST